MDNPSLIISCFPGCGKTYCFQHQDIFPFSIIDIDSDAFQQQNNLWPMNYINNILSNLKKRDIILISQQEEVLIQLNSLNLPFYIVVPNNSTDISYKSRQLIKQQWFGRFILRDNSHISNWDTWIELLKSKYDEWTSLPHLKKHKPLKIFLLNEYEYLSDIIRDLYNTCD